jgi:hypothetical protein
MKYLFIFLLVLTFNATQAQKIDNIYQTWVLSKVSYKDGAELPNANPLKYVYIKYAFKYPNKCDVSTFFEDRGDERPFEVKNGLLLFKSIQGSILNSLQIKEIDDKLMLIQAGNDGFDDPTSILFVFLPEAVYQASVNLKPGDIHSVNNNDTTFVASPACSSPA